MLSDFDSNPQENTVYFEESFKFPVQTGNEQVMLTLLSKEDQSLSNLIGGCQFKLKPEFEDQLVHA